MPSPISSGGFASTWCTRLPNDGGRPPAADVVGTGGVVVLVLEKSPPPAPPVNRPVSAPPAPGPAGSGRTVEAPPGIDVPSEALRSFTKPVAARKPGPYFWT